MPCATSAARTTASPRSRSSRTARSAGRSSSRTSGTPEAFQAIRRETFLLRGRTLADFINKTKTEKWKALVEILGLDAIESLREDLQRARNELRKECKAAEEQVQSCRRALASGRGRHPRNGARQPSADLRDAGRRAARSLDQVVDPVVAHRGGRRQRGRVGALRSREPAGRDQGAEHAGLRRAGVEAWNALVSSERARLLPRASLVREAKRLLEARVDRRTLPALRPDGR